MDCVCLLTIRNIIAMLDHMYISILYVNIQIEANISDRIYIYTREEGNPENSGLSSQQ